MHSNKTISPYHSILQFKKCAFTDRDLADILGRTDLDFGIFLIFGFFGILNSQISRSPEIWLGPGVGRAGPGAWAPRVGREGFLGGPGSLGNCELICFLKDCVYAQAPEEPEKVKCATCGELNLVSDMKMIQSEDLINGTRKQTRCRLCCNLRARLARMIKPGSEVVRGYEELTAKGRTFVPSIHVAYAYIMLQKIQNPNPFCPKCWQGLD